MSREDDPTRAWSKEVSFERKPNAEVGSAWDEELARWETLPAREASLDDSWTTQPLEEVFFAPDAAPTATDDPSVSEAVLPPPPTPLVEVPAPPPVLAPPELEGAPSAGAPADGEPAATAGALEPATKVPFYKRELTFGRKPRESKPKQEKKEKKEKASRRERKLAKAPKPRRQPEAQPDAQPRPESAEAPAKVPFYKREISLRRRARSWDPADRPERQPKPKQERRRRELPRLRRPSLELRGGGSGSKKLVGLKIGASQVAAARVVNNGAPELVQAVRAPLEPGVVVGGELRDPEALANALRDFFKQHKLPRRGIRLGIANNRIGVRTLEVVGIEDVKQLDNAIKFRAQEVLPIPIEDAVLDYQILSESVDADGQHSRRVLLVVAYRELVDRYVAACRKAGLQIVGIDLEAFALLRALSEPRPVAATPESGALVVVAVGHDRSTFAVSDGRVCEFTRVLQWGGSLLNVAIARALDTAPSEAEVVKRALAFSGPEELPPGFNAEQVEVAREAARRELQTFARELVSSLQFYQNQPGSLSIGEIVVTGGTAHLAGLGGELERLLGVPVRIGDPLARVKVSKRVREPEQVGSLAIAIGLAIED